MSLKFCTMLELITLHLECTTAQVKYANFSYGHCADLCFVKGRNGNSFYLLQKAEILVVVTSDRLLSEPNWLLKELLD